MKIAFLGASGTGKTTMAKWVSETYDLEFNPVGARSVAETLGFLTRETRKPDPYLVDIASEHAYLSCLDAGESPFEAALSAVGSYRHGDKTCRELFQRELMKEKIRWEREHVDYVTDRTTVDQLAYWALASPEEVDMELMNRAIDHTAIEYDMVFFCPVKAFFDLAGDAARKTSASYHRIYELFAIGLADRYVRDEKVFTLWVEDLLGRKSQIDTVLRSLEAEE